MIHSRSDKSVPCFRLPKHANVRRRGQVAIEWTLVMVVFGLPMVYTFALLLAVLAEHCRMITLIETLPVP